MVETAVGVNSRNYLLALENLERYGSHMHSITLINFPINSISPTSSMFSHSLHPLFFQSIVSINAISFFTIIITQKLSTRLNPMLIDLELRDQLRKHHHLCKSCHLRRPVLG
ncbi:hypothetical protein YC2023_015856 [Brassica napus]